ncbi:uncharacterized protein LOC133847319 isoform X1 [Drosophila sulfurigaster albostrigata]|uniref:uncharacterized protein LOC133847319 isoform X1 n=1 Tax=Drosophila sulfurigaster albostrigata TaxID=89887 RepID=UPI002D21842B|nr:uncharacterized protein LOC133847319 isoform X1 [Drosophila sulfurigaster albostrigata]
MSPEKNLRQEPIEVVGELTSSFSSLSNISPSVSSSSRGGVTSSVASTTPPIVSGGQNLLCQPKLNRVSRLSNQQRINNWLAFIELDEEQPPKLISQRLSCQNLTPIECVNKQKVLTEWLQSVEQPAPAELQELPSTPQVTSAPIKAAVDFVPPADVAIPLTAIPIMRTLSNSNANIPRLNLNRSDSSEKKQVAAPLSAAEKRLQERRLRREQKSSKASSLPSEIIPNVFDDDDDSFFQELLGAMAKNNSQAPSSLPLDKEMSVDSQLEFERDDAQLPSSRNSFDLDASQPNGGNSLKASEADFNLESSADSLTGSKLNFSRVDLRASCLSFNLAASRANSTPSLKTNKSWASMDRRKRQRLNSSQQSNAMLEMLSLPSQELPSQSVLSFPPSSSVADGNDSQFISESVFRVPHVPPKRLSSTRNSLLSADDDEEMPSSSLWNCASSQASDLTLQFNASSSTAHQIGPATIASSCQQSPPLLDMDVEPSEQSQESLFQLEKRNDANWLPDPRSHPIDPLPRDRMFVKDNAQRCNVDVDLKFMPPSVQKLYTLICGKFSDYAFVYALSSQLSQDCVPMECYVYLKMALLISLVSIELDELRPPISLCVICNDSCATNRLLNSIGQLAPRFIGPHEGGQQPTFNALPARYNWVQASPLMMAQQGVYYAGDWNRLTRDQTEELEKAIENNTLPVPQLQSELPLEAAIWTYWQPENAVNQTTAFAKLGPIFGLPIYVDEPTNSSMWNFVLHAHTRDAQKKPEGINICIEDMRTLLELIQQRQVVFTEPAEQLLKRYFVISRIRQSTAFSSKTYVVLKQFAESLAKLAMRLDVIESDVIVAIFHCEHFVRSIFGAGECPPPAVASFNVISRVDAYMNVFSRWLFQYIEHFEQKLNQ